MIWNDHPMASSRLESPSQIGGTKIPIGEVLYVFYHILDCVHVCAGGAYGTNYLNEVAIVKKVLK